MLRRSTLRDPGGAAPVNFQHGVASHFQMTGVLGRVTFEMDFEVPIQNAEVLGRAMFNVRWRDPFKVKRC